MSADSMSKAQQAVELAKAAGANEVAASINQSRDVTFEYRDGALEKVKDTTSQRLGIQVYAAGRYSSHQTTDLNTDRLKGFVAEAVAITKALEPDEFRKITPAELFAGRSDVDLDLIDPAVAEISRESGTQVERIMPEEPQEMKSLAQHPVRLVVGGQFNELFAFVHALEQMPFTVWIDRLKLQSPGQASEKLTCELSLTVFTDNQDISD